MRLASVLCLLMTLWASTTPAAASYSHRRHATVRTNQSAHAGPVRGSADGPHGPRIPIPPPAPPDGGDRYPYWGM